MTLTVSIMEDDVYTSVRTFLFDILGAGVDVVVGQANKVAEPLTANYVVMTSVARARLATNVETYDKLNPSPDAMLRLQSTRFEVQLDIHGDTSADNAQIISTAFRSEYGVTYFRNLNVGIIPLQCDDGQQMPFINGENQFEQRWVMKAELQINPVVSTPQDFATTLSAQLVSVDATYPPGA